MGADEDGAFREGLRRDCAAQLQLCVAAAFGEPGGRLGHPRTDREDSGAGQFAGDRDHVPAEAADIWVAPTARITPIGQPMGRRTVARTRGRKGSSSRKQGDATVWLPAGASPEGTGGQVRQEERVGRSRHTGRVTAGIRRAGRSGRRRGPRLAPGTNTGQVRRGPGRAGSNRPVIRPIGRGGRRRGSCRVRQGLRGGTARSR